MLGLAVCNGRPLVVQFRDLLLKDSPTIAEWLEESGDEGRHAEFQLGCGRGKQGFQGPQSDTSVSAELLTN